MEMNGVKYLQWMVQLNSAGNTQLITPTWRTYTHTKKQFSCCLRYPKNLTNISITIQLSSSVNNITVADMWHVEKKTWSYLHTRISEIHCTPPTSIKEIVFQVLPHSHIVSRPKQTCRSLAWSKRFSKLTVQHHIMARQDNVSVNKYKDTRKKYK